MGGFGRRLDAATANWSLHFPSFPKRTWRECKRHVISLGSYDVRVSAISRLDLRNLRLDFLSRLAGRTQLNGLDELDRFDCRHIVFLRSFWVKGRALLRRWESVRCH